MRPRPHARPRRDARRALPAALAVVASLAPAAAHAQQHEPTAEDRATARLLATEGIDAAARGDCAAAIGRLERAEALFHAPTHLRYLAECFERTGRVVESAEAWHRLTLEPLALNAPQAFRDAVDEAQRQLPRVQALEARLTVHVVGPTVVPDVRIDGRQVPTASLGQRRVIDPGEHTVTASAPGLVAAPQTVRVAPGGSADVSLELVPVAEAGAARGVTVTDLRTDAQQRHLARHPPRGRTSNALTVAGIAIGTIGILVAGSGIATGVLAELDYNQLTSNCPMGFCASDNNLLINSIDRYATLTNVFIITGAALAGLGVVLVVVAPRPPVTAPGAPAPPGTPAVHASAGELQFAPLFVRGGGGLGLSGTF